MAFSRLTTDSASKWITRPEFLASAILIALAFSAPAALAAAAGEAPSTALTNEDVVRMVGDRLPLEQILHAIRSASATAFDLEPDMVIELRRAGVPDAVIAAMHEVQRAPRRAPETGAASGTGTVRLVFEKPGGAIQRGTAVSAARDWNDRPMSLAFFVICLDPLHAPDLWDTKTPLRGAFPRHHVLWFLDRTLPLQPERRGALVYLDLPEGASFEAEAGEHALRIGVAARAGNDGWEPVATASATLRVAAGGTSRLIVHVETAGTGRLSRALGSRPSITCNIVRVEQAPAASADPNAAVPAP